MEPELVEAELVEEVSGGIWTVLGDGSILPRKGYGCSGYALQLGDEPAVTLFDCGPGTLRALAECDLALADVKRVVISHFHADHCLDLFALGFARSNPSFEAPELELIGPAGLQEFVATVGAALGGAPARGFEGVRFIEVEPGEKVASREFPEFELSTVATHHTRKSLAWRIDLEGGASLTYSGDSGEEKAVAELARATSLFVCECSFPTEKSQPNHLTPAGAAGLAAHADAEALLLTHFYPEMDPERAAEEAARVYSGPIEIARDGSSHRFPVQRTGSSG